MFGTIPYGRLVGLGVSALTFATLTGTAAASGYQIREQSAKVLANAAAGSAAAAEDVSFMAYNPASIGRLSGTQVSGALSYVDPTFELHDASASTVLGTPITGPTDDGGRGTFVPSAMAKWRLSDQVDLGLGIYSPWGLSTKYDRSWIGRYHAVESELKTVDINPVISFKPTRSLTLAAGLVAQYADATLSSAIDFGTAGYGTVPGASPGKQDGFVKVTGDDWAMGYTLGVLYEFTDRTRAGIGYRSRVSHTLSGDSNVTYDQSGIGRTLANAGAGFTNTGASADITTPAVVTASLYHELDDRWSVMAGLEWTRWSEFDHLVVQFDNNTPDAKTTENWKNTLMASVGASYRATDQWTLRGGAGYDPSPVPDAAHRTTRIPD
ncbi:MAG TPA: outer membrane protein transport protein, partial [Gammaproteobacteria bacterium]|nr:outer membrane protein transport protein [Gammaproteobacteria bacterium]